MINSAFAEDDLDHVWFTADNHFSHKNIIEYCNRPFKTVEEMDDCMISRWNQKIGVDDIVYHLGDFTLQPDASDYFYRLNGYVFMLELEWHHDKRWLSNPASLPILKNGDMVNFLAPIYVIRLKGFSERPLPITLSHYPMAEWEASFHGSWQLHGHSHGNHVPQGKNKFVLDVGVDCHNFWPISLRTVMENMIDIGWE